MVRSRTVVGEDDSDAMNLVARLRQDELFGRVVGNSAHLFSSNSLSIGLSVVQSIVAARLLGPASFGLVGIVMSFASTVNGVFSFRMSELVVRYGGAYLEQKENRKAAALIRAAGVAEAGVSVLAFVFVFMTATLAAQFIAKAPATRWMFVLYGLGLLANFNAETSTGVLQVTDGIKARGTINVVQSVISALATVGAAALYAAHAIDAPGALWAVLGAYLAGKVILGMGLFAVAQARLSRFLGAGWFRVGFAELPSFRELFGFAFSSNLSATAILVFRESELLWIGLFLNSEAAGLYKIAYTVVSFLSVPADPLILSVYPETNRLIVQRAWGRLRSFLAKVTGLSFACNVVLGLAFIVFGRWILSVFGVQYLPAYPALLTLLVGLAFNYTLFWNRPLLLSFGLQTFALWAILVAGVIKLALAFPLVPRYGFVMEAALLSSYYILSVGLIVGRGLQELGRQERMMS